MRVVVQRVKEAAVSIQNNCCAEIKQGLLLLVGIHSNDTSKDLEWMCNKICKLRIFADENGAMNKSVVEVNGDILLVSQFTLYADVQKGNRPSFMDAAAPAIAAPLIEEFKLLLANCMQKEIPSGVFGADMQVTLTNDGPVTILIDSTQKS